MLPEPSKNASKADTSSNRVPRERADLLRDRPDAAVPAAPDSETPPDRRALDEIFSIVYEELRHIASSVRHSNSSYTLNSTALVNEAWLKLKESPHLAGTSLSHFKAIAVKAMRQILVDAARRRKSQKRNTGEIVPLKSEELGGVARSGDVEIIMLDDALEQLAKLNGRQAMVIEYRFFGGFSVSETAELLKVSESVVERDWRFAKAWLTTVIQPDVE